MQKEAKARIKINELLQNAGWRFFDNDQGPATVVLENNAKLTKQAVDELGNDFDKTKNGEWFHLNSSDCKSWLNSK